MDKKLPFFFLLVFLMCLPFVGISQKLTLWGDQGDGTYLNPILNADYPDVDIQRFGDKYYMITSTAHFTPGMTILESEDLVNWKIIGHVFGKLSWDPRYNWDKMAGYGGGIWAGVLARHDNLWYCYFIYEGLYVSTSEDIRGPWSEPLLIREKNVATDPGVFWDETEKKAWLICKAGKDFSSSDPLMREVRLYQLSWDGFSVLDTGKIIYRGRGSEACKIYKVNGLFYVFLVDNDPQDSDRKQIVLRGPDLEGPLERKVILERGNGVTRSCSQGALVQAPDGSWWLSHQLKQAPWENLDGIPSTASYEGRPQYLVPVRWEYGWPLAGEDPDGNGIGNTVHQYRKPVQGFPIDAPQTDDEFASAELGLQWQWNHNPRDTHWSLTERTGWLRLKASQPLIPEMPLRSGQRSGDFWNASNTISQRLMGTGKGKATTRMDVSGMKPGQLSGMCHFGGQYFLIGVEMDEEGNKYLFFNHNGLKTKGMKFIEGIIYFRTEMNSNKATFSYSLNNREWIPVGHEFALTMGSWRGDRIGFFCLNKLNDTSPDSGFIDIDWFHYNYDGPKKSYRQQSD